MTNRMIPHSLGDDGQRRNAIRAVKASSADLKKRRAGSVLATRYSDTNTNCTNNNNYNKRRRSDQAKTRMLLDGAVKIHPLHGDKRKFCTIYRMKRNRKSHAKVPRAGARHYH